MRRQNTTSRESCSRKKTHKPIADAKVNVLNSTESDPSKRLLSGTTDSDGRYRIEVPLGSVRLWYSRLKPGYWLEPDENIKELVTTPDQPIVTHDIAANIGIAWPVLVTVEDGIPDGAEVMVSLTEVEDDATRQKMLSGEGVSFMKSVNSSMSTLGASGRGAFTQCGETGKLVVGIGSRNLGGIMTELIVTPGFEITKVKSIRGSPARTRSR